MRGWRQLLGLALLVFLDVRESCALDETTTGIDVANGAVAFDPVEVGTTSWNSGATFTWTFNTAAALDPAIEFAGGTIRFHGGTSATYEFRNETAGALGVFFDDFDNGSTEDARIRVDCVDTTTDDCSFRIGVRLGDTNDITVFDAIAKVEGDNDIIIGTTGADSTDTISLIVNGEVAGDSGFVAPADGINLPAETNGTYVGNVTAGDGITVSGTPAENYVETVAVVLRVGANADSTTITSDSGLEFISGQLTMLRGCAANEILKWDEAGDNWDCAADAGAASPALSAITAAVATNSISNAEFTQTWLWDSGPTAVVYTGMAFTFSHDATTDITAQTGVLIQRDATTGTAAFETLLHVNQADSDGSVVDGILVGTVGVMTDGVDVSDPEIVNGLNLGANNFVFTSSTWGNGAAVTLTFDSGTNDNTLTFGENVIIYGTTAGDPQLQFDNPTGTGTDNAEIMVTCANATNCGLEFYADVGGVLTKFFDLNEGGTGTQQPTWGDTAATIEHNYRGLDPLEVKTFTATSTTANIASEFVTDCATVDNCTVRWEHRVGAVSNVDLINAVTSAGVVTTTIGAASTGSITLATNGTGDLEVELPNESINLDELTDAGDVPATNECLKVAATTTEVKYENCITNSGTLFTVAGGDSGSEPIAGADTATFQGTASATEDGIDVTVTATDTVNIKFDATEVDTRTWGAGAGWTWTFDAGATDPTIAFASDALTLDSGTDASQVTINDRLRFLDTAHTFTATSPVITINEGTTLTLSGSQAFLALRAFGTIVYNDDPPGAGSGNVFFLASTITQQSGETRDWNSLGGAFFRAFTYGATWNPTGGTIQDVQTESFFHNPSFTVDAAETLDFDTIIAFSTKGGFNVSGGGTLSVGLFEGVRIQTPYVNVGSPTMTTGIGLHITDFGGTYDTLMTLDPTNEYSIWAEGIDAPSLHFGTFGIGIQPTVGVVPTAQLEVQASVEGSPMFEMNTNLATDAREIVRQYIASTTGTTEVNDANLAVASGETLGFHLFCVAQCTGGSLCNTTESAFYERAGFVKNDGGTTAISTVVSIAEAEDGDFGASNCTVEADNATDQLNLSFTGVTNLNVSWIATLRIFPHP